MTVRIRIRIWLLAAICIAGPVVSAADQSGADTSRQKFDVLVERNMFSRQRGAASKSRSGQEVVPPPEHFVVLTGLVRQNGEYFAFLEDSKKGTVTRVHAGDAVLDGRVSSVALDAIEYTKESGTLKVKLGQNLEGGDRPLAPPSNAAATGASGGAGVAPQAAPSSGQASAPAGDIVEQMRQRRQKELGQ
jgi:hypothetical protein